MTEPRTTDHRRSYWQRNLRLTAGLLAVWFVVTFVLPFFARDLRFRFFGWPFSFWAAAQGALVVYLLLVCYYARAMNRLDHEHGVAEAD
jgi:putative solute:sodium symporter small subunit